MEKKTRKKSQLSIGFDKFNIIAIVIVVIITLFAVGFGITKIVYKPNKSSEIGDYNKNIVEDVKQVTMPKIAGETKANAVNKLEQMNLKVKVIEKTSQTIAPGCVIKQSINSGVIIDEKTTITLVVSKGEK